MARTKARRTGGDAAKIAAESNLSKWRDLAVHAFLAGLGAFLLLARMIPLRTAALIGAAAYAFSGYFADHSSHLGMFSIASLTPWLLLCFQGALEHRTARFTALGGMVGGA